MSGSMIFLQEYFFYVWDIAQSVIRLMASFDTGEEEIEGFVQLLNELVTRNL